jgi:hypothetical protein
VKAPVQGGGEGEEEARAAEAVHSSMLRHFCGRGKRRCGRSSKRWEAH